MISLKYKPNNRFLKLVSQRVLEMQTQLYLTILFVLLVIYLLFFLSRSCTHLFRKKHQLAIKIRMLDPQNINVMKDARGKEGERERWILGEERRCRDDLGEERSYGDDPALPGPAASPFPGRRRPARPSPLPGAAASPSMAEDPAVLGAQKP